MQPLKKQSLVDDMIKEVFEYIDTSGLKPGDKLPSERELMEIWQASRTSVREAMKALEFAGVVTIKRGDGTYLNETNKLLDMNYVPSDSSILTNHPYIKQIMEARTLMELQLLPLAIERITDAELSDLEKRNEDMKAAKEAGDKDAYVQSDVAFHLTLAKAAKNDVLWDFLNSVIFRAFKQLTDKQVITVDSFYESCLDTHEELLKAIRMKDLTLATKLLTMNTRSSSKAAERSYLSTASSEASKTLDNI